MRKRITLILYIQLIVQLIVIYHLIALDTVGLLKTPSLLLCLCSIVVGVFILFLNYFVHKLLKCRRNNSTKEEISTKFNLKENSTIVCWILFSFSVCVIEEILVRYYLFNFLTLKVGHILIPILVTSLFFSLYHLNKNKIIELFLMGLILILFYIATLNILYPIIAHFTNNILIYYLYLVQKPKIK